MIRSATAETGNIRARARVYNWALLLLLTFGFAYLPDSLYWLGPGFAHVLPETYMLALVALLMVAWRPEAFGLKLGNHQKVWWIYLACGAAYIGYARFAPGLWPEAMGKIQHGPSMYLVTPFWEELLFRGFIYGVLVDMYPSSEASSRWISKPVLFSSILFGLGHLSWIAQIGWGWGLGEVGGTFAAGLVMGYVRRRSGSVLGPFLMHVFGNLAVAL